MNTARRSRNPRSAAVSAEDQPQRPRNLVGNRWIRRRPLRPTCCGWCSAHTAALREKSSRAARILQSRWQPSEHRQMADNVGRLVPEGHHRRLAGGKPAPAGAAPGCHAERGVPQRGIGEFFGVARPAASPSSLVASGSSGRQRLARVPDQFFDAPLGHGTIRHGFRGRRTLLRTCPRLISCGVPPGREPVAHALTTGNHRRENDAPKSFGGG